MASIEHTAGEPAVERRVGAVQDLVPGLDPVDAAGSVAPEAFGVVQRTGVKLCISAGHEQRLLLMGAVILGPLRYGKAPSTRADIASGGQLFANVFP
jgi:hypothetical protein